MADSVMKKVRKSNFSPEEVEALVETVKKHYSVLYGQYSKRAVNKIARHKSWLDVLKRVNQVSIERRTLQEVKNKWKKCQHFYKIRDREHFEPNDSMPLEHRMNQHQNSNSENHDSMLHSQSLSPTKLKVTRHAQRIHSSKAPSPEPVNEEVCLRWNSHHSNMQSSFPTLLLREQYVDVTLVAEGRTLKCHRLILSSCSPYFEEVLSGISPMQHPVLFLKDTPFWIVKCLCDFMYAGEVHIFQNKLEELLSVAEALKIKGLAGKSNDPPDPDKTIKEEPKSQHKSVKVEDTKKEVDDDVLDPLDLLEPVYEEITKENKPSTSNPKPKDNNKFFPMKKSFPKKIKKRKYSEEREETPPVFLQRKGTRSRPNVKVPKYYHYGSITKNEDSSERDSHNKNMSDAFLEPNEIKSEPLDPDDDVIEIEDNAVSFTDEEGHDEDESMIEYDNPIENFQGPSKSKNENLEFKKINLSAPIIMGIHTVGEKSNLEIIDMSKNGGKIRETKTIDPLDTGLEIIDTTNNKIVNDPLSIAAALNSREKDNQMTISNIRTVNNETKDEDDEENELLDDLDPGEEKDTNSDSADDDDAAIEELLKDDKENEMSKSDENNEDLDETEEQDKNDEDEDEF